MDAEPSRQVEHVDEFLRTQRLQLLVVADKPFQGGTMNDFGCRQLLFERGPLWLRRMVARCFCHARLPFLLRPSGPVLIGLPYLRPEDRTPARRRCCQTPCAITKPTAKPSTASPRSTRR